MILTINVSGQHVEEIDDAMQLYAHIRKNYDCRSIYISMDNLCMPENINYLINQGFVLAYSKKDLLFYKK